MFLGEGLYTGGSSYTILALNTRCQDVLLQGRKIRFVRKGTGFYPQGQAVWHMEDVQKVSCKMINCYKKPAFGTLWAEITCKFLKEQKSAASHAFQSTRSKLILVTDTDWMPGARSMQSLHTPINPVSWALSLHFL